MHNVILEIDRSICSMLDILHRLCVVGKELLDGLFLNLQFSILTCYIKMILSVSMANDRYLWSVSRAYDRYLWSLIRVYDRYLWSVSRARGDFFRPNMGLAFFWSHTNGRQISRLLPIARVCV